MLLSRFILNLRETAEFANTLPQSRETRTSTAFNVNRQLMLQNLQDDLTHDYEHGSEIEEIEMERHVEARRGTLSFPNDYYIKQNNLTRDSEYVHFDHISPRALRFAYWQHGPRTSTGREQQV